MIDSYIDEFLSDDYYRPYLEDLENIRMITNKCLEKENKDPIEDALYYDMVLYSLDNALTLMNKLPEGYLF